MNTYATQVFGKAGYSFVAGLSLLFGSGLLPAQSDDAFSEYRDMLGDDNPAIFVIEEGADFGELAKLHSKCPSGAEGGALGTFGPGQMVREFDEVVFSAPIGEVQGPVKTQFGYHLLEVTARAD